MTVPTLAELGWLEGVIEDHLKPALKAAEQTRAQLANLRLCDHAGCGRMFDGSDPRSATVTHGGATYHFCPACEFQAPADKMMPASPSAPPPAGYDHILLGPLPDDILSDGAAAKEG